MTGRTGAMTTEVSMADISNNGIMLKGKDIGNMGNNGTMTTDGNIMATGNNGSRVRDRSSCSMSKNRTWRSTVSMKGINGIGGMTGAERRGKFR